MRACSNADSIASNNTYLYIVEIFFNIFSSFKNIEVENLRAKIITSTKSGQIIPILKSSKYSLNYFPHLKSPVFLSR